MKIETRYADNVTVLALIGRMCKDDHDSFIERIETLIRQNRANVLLDLSACPSFNSMALGSVILAYTLLNKSGGALKLAAPTQSVRDLLKVTKTIEVLTILDTVEEAVDSFRPHPTG